MLKKFFLNQSKTITSAAIIIGATSLLSRILGIFRDRVLASEFGASRELDIYYAAFRIPDLVFNLLILGALSAGFIPVFSQYLNQPKKAWRLVNIILNLIFIFLVLLSGLLFFLAPWLTKIITPGFDQSSLDVTTNLSRIMFFSPILLGLAGVFAGVLQSFKRFFLFSIAPILYNLGIIIGAIFLTDFFGIYGLAWGVVFGSLLHLAVQVFASWLLGYHYQWILDFTDKGVLQIIKMMVPRTLALMVGQINLLVITMIGSTLAVGSIAVFNLANNIQSFPLGLFGVSFAIAVFPSLSQQVKKKKDFVEILSLAIRQILFFILPASALLIVLRAQVVRVILGAGKFDWEDTVITLETLSFFAISLFAQSLILVLVRAFYAKLDSKTPFYLGLISAFANLIFAFTLTPNFGVSGLAIAFSLASILNLVLLILALHFQLGRLDGGRIAISTIKILISTFMLAIVAQAIKYPMEKYFGLNTFIGISLQTGAAALGGLLIYFMVAFFLQSEELKMFIDALKNKLSAKPVVTKEIIEEEKLS